MTAIALSFEAFDEPEPGHVWQAHFERHTAAYDVRAGTATYRWPGLTWEQSFAAFNPGVQTIVVESTAAA